MHFLIALKMLYVSFFHKVILNFLATTPKKITLINDGTTISFILIILKTIKIAKNDIAA